MHLHDLDEAIRRLEAPDCGCPFKRIPCQCDAYQSTGDCDHPPTYTPPCEHVRAIDVSAFPLAFEEWADLLTASDPPAYCEPIFAPAPSRVVTRQARIAVLADRFANAESLWHPRDGWRDPDGPAAPQTRHLRNGRDDENETLVPSRRAA